MTSFLFLLAFSRKSMRNSSASRRFCGVVNWGGAKTDVQAASKSPILNILKIQNFRPEFNDHTPLSKFYLFFNLKSCDWCLHVLSSKSTDLVLKVFLNIIFWGFFVNLEDLSRWVRWLMTTFNDDKFKNFSKISPEIFYTKKIHQTIF